MRGRKVTDLTVDELVALLAAHASLCQPMDMQGRDFFIVAATNRLNLALVKDAHPKQGQPK